MTDDEQIGAILQRIEDTFSRLDLSGWLECFHPLAIAVIPPFEPVSLQDTEACQALLEPYAARLQAAGFNRTQMGGCAIRYLTETTALVTVRWTRYGGDNVLESIGGTYLFLKTAEGWRITMLTSHPPESGLLHCQLASG